MKRLLVQHKAASICECLCCMQQCRFPALVYQAATVQQQPFVKQPKSGYVRIELQGVAINSVVGIAAISQGSGQGTQLRHYKQQHAIFTKNACGYKALYHVEVQHFQFSCALFYNNIRQPILLDFVFWTDMQQPAAKIFFRRLPLGTLQSVALTWAAWGGI